MTDSIPSWRQTAPAGISLAAAMARHRPPLTATAIRRLPAAMQQILRPNAAPNWRSAKVANMTPARVEQILDLGLSGDACGQWELFDLMEDTWPRLAKNLSEIKRTVAAMKWTVTPWAEDDEEPSDDARQRAKLVSHCLWRMAPVTGVDEVEFTGMVHDLLDAWGKGVSVMEILWEEYTSPPFGLHIRPRALQWVHPSNLGIAADGSIGLRTTPTEYYLTRPYDAQDIMPFPDYKFLCGIKRAKSSAILGGAMLRPLAWWWAASNFSASWLLNYAQLFGVPMRWAKYPAGADAALIANINSILEDFGNSSFASMPEGTELTIIDSNKTAGSSPQDGILDRANEYCDLLILGQTLTSSTGGSGSQALGRVHERVKGDVIKAATDWVATVINQQLVTAILDLNYGDREAAPEVTGRPDTVNDQVQDANRDAILLGAGMPLPKKWLYQRHGVPLPKDDEEMIGQPPAMAPAERNDNAPKEVQRAQSGGSPAKPRDTEEDAPTVQSATPALPTRPSVCRCLPRAVSAAGQTPETPSDPTDAIAARKADALAAAFRGSLAPVRAAILASTSPEDARRRLAALYMDWSPVKVAEVVQEAFELCAVEGLGGDTVEARFSEDQPRDEGGRWTSTGGGVSVTREGDSWKRADGKPMPEGLYIPPNWSSVKISEDPNDELLAVGRDAKGREQRIYSDSFVKGQSEKKFGRVAELRSKADEVRATIRADANGGTDPESASALMLIESTGIRPGSDSDTGAAKKAYGATTLEGRHVKVGSGGDVTLEFTGKKGVALKIPVEDSEVASMLVSRKTAAGDGGRIFKTDDGRLRDYANSRTGFKPKDFRTSLGTRTAQAEVARIGRKAANEKEYKKLVKEVAVKVSNRLGNTPTIALQSYIDPSIFVPLKP